MPPGSAMNASARSSMTCLRSRIGVGDDEFVGVDVGELAVHERLRDDPDGAAAARPGPGGQRAHGRDVSAAGHQGPAAIGDGVPDSGGQLQQFGVPWTRRAVDTDRPFAARIRGHTDNVDEYGPAASPTP